jgi:hypothetical protein
VNWGEIRKEYETTNITLKELAEKYGIKLGTLKSRKTEKDGQGILLIRMQPRKRKRLQNQRRLQPLNQLFYRTI